jgi:hypothetical protein
MCKLHIILSLVVVVDVYRPTVMKLNLWNLLVMDYWISPPHFRRVHRIVSFVMSLCPSAWNNSVTTGRILMVFDIWTFFENLPGKFVFDWNPTRITEALHEDVFTFMTISRWIILRMRNLWIKSCRENQNTYFMFSNVFRKSCRLWDNVEKCDGAREAADNMEHARCTLDK